MAKGKNSLPLLNCVLACVLLSGGWLMKSFPTLIFVALAPLFALTNVPAANQKIPWVRAELILVALGTGFFAASIFRVSAMLTTIIQAITYSLSFVAYFFVQRSSGAHTSKLLIILFWLSTEYLFLKILGEKSIFLADALELKRGWTRWNGVTGYLGSSFWILVSNFLLYEGLLERGPLKPGYLIFFVILVVMPIVYSYYLTTDSITRLEMVSASDYSSSSTESYHQSGEWIPRTAAWISGLILIFAFITKVTKSK
jgi:hypothetical protein